MRGEVTMPKEVFVDFGREDDRNSIKTYNVYCQISKSNVTLIKEHRIRMKITCPHAILNTWTNKSYNCNLTKTFWSSPSVCGIYEGMKEGD